MRTVEELFTNAARSIQSLGSTVQRLAGSETEGRALLRIASRARRRGYFTPGEDDAVRARFAKYLTAREALLQTIQELAPLAERYEDAPDAEAQLRGFVLGYTASCLLVHAGRHLVEQWGADALVQRKLDEPEPRYRIPGKQFTSVYRNMTSPLNAWRLRAARQFANRYRDEIRALGGDSQLGPVVAILDSVESSIVVSARTYLVGRLRYRWHNYRRRRSSAWSRVMFGILEYSGRVVAEIRSPWHRVDRVESVRDEIASLLRPGDVLVTRHDDAMSNLFLPGYWPHASLYVGHCDEAHACGIRVDEARLARWRPDNRVLEARKDGVLLRPLHDTLAVDAVAVLRPKLGGVLLHAGLQRILEHEGKMYNFDFDFFRTDRLVCTEVIYRAFDGLGGISFKLVRRQGRLTLSAEDIVRMAVEGRGFEPVAVFGAPGCETRVLKGAEASDAMRLIGKTAENT